MKIKLLVLMVVAGVCLLCTSVFAQSYYSGGKEIPLKIDQGKVRIKFDDQLTDSQRNELVSTLSELGKELWEPARVDNFYSYDLNAGSTYDQVAADLRAREMVRFVEPYYISENGEPLLTGITFCVGFNSDVTPEEIARINAENGVAIERHSEYLKSTYLLRITDSNKIGLLATANAYYELERTYFSHPEIGGAAYFTAYTVTDKFMDYQWNIQRVIGQLNVNSVWDFAGLTDSIIVAVIDDGVTTHRELPAERVLPGCDFFDYDTLPQPGERRNHGMACAGLIAAEHTVESFGLRARIPADTGDIISMNPHVKILPVKIADKDGNIAGPFAQAQAISYAWHQGADVLSNSWGSIVCDDAVVTAIDSAVTRGRNNRGSVVIFASGNSAVNYPDSLPAYACHPSVIAVGASDFFDHRFNFSMYGDELDLLAPGSMTCHLGDIYTLDQMGYFGMNPYESTAVGCIPQNPIIWNCPTLDSNDINYDCHFGGTSAAAPIVAGVASLLLSRKPDLPAFSYCDTSDYSVYDILTGSAVHDDTMTVPNHQYGYGRVDAYRAILSIARGDVNNDGEITLDDIMYLANWLFVGPPAPWPDERLGDVNCDGEYTLGDVMLLVDYVCISGAPLPLPCFEFDY
jgi:subtilisin family serine protease